MLLAIVPGGAMISTARVKPEFGGRVGSRIDLIAYWTTARVATVIRREYGGRHHPAHVSRILKELRWTVQTPVKRSIKRDEAAVTAFREEREPALRAKPRLRSARSSTSMNPVSTRCRL